MKRSSSRRTAFFFFLLAACVVLLPSGAWADYVMPRGRPGSSVALKRQFQRTYGNPFGTMVRNPLGGSSLGTAGIGDLSSGAKAVAWFQQSVLRKIRLYLDLEEIFDDNIFRTSEDKEADLITKITTGFRYGFSPRIFAKQKFISTGFKFDLGFRLRWILYRNNPQLNQTANLNSLFGKGKGGSNGSGSGGGLGSGGFSGGGISGGLVSPDININLEPSRRFQVGYIGRSQLNSLVEIDPIANRELDRNKKQWIDSWENRYKLGYTFGPAPTQFVLDFTRIDKMYQDVDGWKQEDTSTDRVMGRMFLGSPKAKKRYFVGADFTTKKHPENKSRKTPKDGNIFVGVKGQFSPKITGVLDAGYGAVGIGSGFDKMELITPIYRVRLLYQMYRRFGIIVAVNRFVAEDREYDEAETDAEVSTEFLRRDRKLSDTAALDFVYEHPFSVKRKFGKFGIKAGVRLKRVEYTVGDDDLSYNFRLNPHYELNDRTTLIFEYVHERRLSSPSIEGYINNRFSAKLKWEF